MAAFSFTTESMAQVPSYVPTNGLVGWWPFNGNANDESGNGNNGTVNGASLTSDRFTNANSSYSFDGVDDKISTSILPSLNDFSFNVFFQTQSTNGSFKRLIDIDNASGSYFDLFISPDNTAGAHFRVNNIQYNYASSTQLSNTDWHCMTFTRNNDIGYFYIDGTFVENQNVTNTPFLVNALLTFGHTDLGGYPDQFYFGKIDDIGFWNRALTQQEITNLYNGCQLSVNTQPTNQTVNINNSAQFVVGLSDPSATYQWQTNGVNLGWQNIPINSTYSGVTTNTLTVNNVQLANHNQPFRVIGSNGNCTDTSNIATIQIADTCITNVTVYDTLLTTVTDTLIINTTLSLPTPNNENTILIYPNPASDHITIDNGNFAAMAGYSIKITNNAGQEVFLNAINQQQFYVDLSTWSGNGLYFVHLIDSQNNTVTVRKIVLQ